MNTWSKMCRTVIMITFFMTILNGCGGSTNNGAVTTTTDTTTPTVSAIQPYIKNLTAPTHVSAVGGTNKITIGWSVVSDVTSYNIYWSSTSGVVTLVANKVTNSGTTFIHRGLLPNTTYYYIVTAQNNSGESVASGQVSAATTNIDGAALYNRYCVHCHGPLTTSIATNASTADIKAAMKSFNSMSTITLTDSQISFISAALMDNY